MAPLGLKVGDVVISSDTADIKVGNSKLLKDIPVGTLVHNVELHPGAGGQMARSAGSYIQVMAKEEDSILLNYGYQGVVSIIDAMVDRHDVIVYDAESHACIVDGVRLHQGQRFMFKHNDMESCEKQLQRATRLVEKSIPIFLFLTG